MPKETAYLLSQVNQNIVPLLERYGFEEVLEYGGSRASIGANVLPFQIRAGTDWPTVEILFSPDKRPWFRIELGRIQHEVRSREGKLLTRAQCTLLDCDEYYVLAKNSGTTRSLFSQFGYHWWSLLPQRKLDKEISTAASALTNVLEFFIQSPASQLQTIVAMEHGYISNNLIRNRVPGRPGKR